MDTFDQALLDHVIRWCTYGGGDEHILPEFGLTPEAFYRRVLTIVERRAQLDFAAKRYLLAYCSEKLAACVAKKPVHSRSDTGDPRRPRRQLADEISHRIA